MEGLIMRLEYLNRSLANLDSPHTDEIMLLIGEAISCMSRDRSLSLEFSLKLSSFQIQILVLIV